MSLQGYSQRRASWTFFLTLHPQPRPPLLSRATQERLQADLTSFADEYHDRVLKGLALPAESYEQQDEDEEGGEGGTGEENQQEPRRQQQQQQQQQQQPEATILPDGTIDVTPLEPRPLPVRQARFFF